MQTTGAGGPRDRGAGPPDLAVLRDPARLAAVRRILGGGPRPASVQRLAALAATVLDAPTAQVSLLSDEQVVAAATFLAPAAAAVASPLADGLCAVTAASGDALAVANAPLHPWVASLPPVLNGVVGSYLGAPLRTEDGNILGSLCVYSSAPREWTPREVAALTALAAEVTEELQAHAAAALSADEAARLDLALAAAEIGRFDYDLVTWELVGDERMIRLFGHEPETFGSRIDDFSHRLHPQDLKLVVEAIGAAVEARSDLAVDCRLVLPDGRVRWIQARGRVMDDMLGRPARLLGAAFDTTALRESRDELAHLLETMTDAFYRLDADWRFTYVNVRAERLLRLSRDELLGRVIWEALPEAVGSEMQAMYEQAMDSGELLEVESYSVLLETWFELRAWPTADGLSVYFHDISARKWAEAEREEAVTAQAAALARTETANARLGLLAEASVALTASLEPRAVLAMLAGLLVPALGQWAAVALTGDFAAPVLDDPVLATRPHVVHVVEVAHSQPQRDEGLRASFAAVPLLVGDPHGLGAVIANSTPEWAPCTDLPAGTAGTESGAMLTVPMTSRGRMLGAVTVAGAGGAALDGALISDLVGRAGVALDNALLLGAERRIALELQRNLLPTLTPQPADIMVATRYIPAMTGALAGGDFYQVVEVGDSLVLALGDVLGHSMQSAAQMGQLRAVVAALALEGHAPGELLYRLATHGVKMLDLPFATLLVASYDRAARTLTVASAGHPPPLLAPLHGPPSYLVVEPGPPLGVGPGEYPESTVDVPVASTLVLYSDGLVEDRRDPDIDTGLDRLRDAITDVRQPPERVADHILHTLGREHGGEDDIALLVFTHVATAFGSRAGIPLVLPSEPGSVPVARGYAISAAKRHGCTGLAETIALLVSEVVTNAVVHGTGEVSVGVVGRPDGLLVEIGDASTRAPQLRHARADDTGGRGLALVDVLAADWGTRSRDGGKTVWFTLASSLPPDEGTDRAGPWKAP